MPVTNDQITVDNAQAYRIVPTLPPRPPGPAARRVASGPQRFVQIKNIGPATVYLGSSSVTKDDGVPIVSGGVLTFWMMTVDDIWGITASGAAVVSYIETGGESLF